ncbi:TonB-dependent receptor [Shimia sp. CNT1-13L.2]|uniref:TonB-dependent receptor domain-containing protein n=1 Tax=Shimia sp. CNT1-13L.2 TaxID=2959663 RepID=UPI0020CBB52B|nr:TonB-dependent receptor [Shimia sp. CNT1-13L.2]MCP9484111.1 TonB-dependent receptor [Shimia sp. CNT1-13L.2]
MAQESDPILLEEINVRANDLATQEKSQSTIDSERLEEEFSGAPISTVLQSIPGVTTESGDGGDAEVGINIRGLQDHGRVAVTIDGVRQNFAKSGHGANGTFAADSEMLREITVQRGAGGKSGAIGGSVEMRTVGADDLIEDGETQGGEVRLRYGTLTKEPTLHAAAATRFGDTADLTFAFTRAFKDNYTAPDGTFVYAGQQTRSYHAGLGFNTQNGHRLSFTASTLAQDYLVSLQTSTPDDTDLRKKTFTLGFESDDIFNGWFMDGTLYQTETNVLRTELDTSFVPTGTVHTYETGTTGFVLEAGRTFETGNLLHDLTITTEAFRDKVDTQARVGSLTPSGTRDVFSFAVEDRIDFGSFSTTFGVSHDTYKLSSPGILNKGSATSPRIAVNVPLGTSFHAFASATKAFRSPSLNESLVEGQHPPPTFDVKPNPNLRPERSTSYELGLGYVNDGLFSEGDRLDIRGTLFRNNVKDFIGFEWVGTLFSGYYQYQNIDHVEIQGFELETSYTSDRFFINLSGQLLEGRDLSTGSKLSEIPPARVTLSGGFYSKDGRSTYGARLTATASQKDSGGVVRTPSWSTVDLFYNRDLGENMTFSLALNNILDATYTIHLQTEPQPGFNAQASLVFRF